MRDVMVDIFRERSTIQRGMRDFSATVGKLDRILMLLFGVIVTLICLGIFNISVSSYLVTATSIVVSLSFIIGSSAKGLFESIVFLFFVHPFDVGDKVGTKSRCDARCQI